MKTIKHISLWVVAAVLMASLSTRGNAQNVSTSYFNVDWNYALARNKRMPCSDQFYAFCKIYFGNYAVNILAVSAQPEIYIKYRKPF